MQPNLDSNKLLEVKPHVEVIDAQTGICVPVRLPKVNNTAILESRPFYRKIQR